MFCKCIEKFLLEIFLAEKENRFKNIHADIKAQIFISVITDEITMKIEITIERMIGKIYWMDSVKLN